MYADLIVRKTSGEEKARLALKRKRSKFTLFLYISAPQPFLTHGTLKPCPNFCGIPQQKSAENLHIKSL